MNARPTGHELYRIRRNIGSALRVEHEVKSSAPESLVALLRELQTRILDAERERLIAEVDARVEELLRAAARQPRVWHHRNA
jgi:hypothetical protein